MTVRDIATMMESWAPRPLAWDRDNIGLLVGASSKPVRKILVALDVTDEVVEDARRRGVDLLVTHHPLIFGSLKSVTDADRTGLLVTKLIRYDIALYAAHTNLDFTTSGVSAALARKLGLVDARVLHQDQKPYQKIVVFAPTTHAERVMQAMATAGAGHIGKYDACSFQTEGFGTFRPLEGTKPYIGTQGKLERVPETRLEMVAPAWLTKNVITAMRSAHPYEEVAYDIFDLANASTGYGAGMIGDLPAAETLGAWLQHVHKILETPALRYCGNPRTKIRRIAVCGGSGTDLLPVAVQQGADVLLTADVKYHAFQDAEGRIALVDAGHFETEVPIVDEIVSFITHRCREKDAAVRVSASRRSHNPVQYSTS